MIIPLFFQYFPNLSPKKLEPSQAVGLFKAMNVGAQCTVSGPSGTVLYLGYDMISPNLTSWHGHQYKYTLNQPCRDWHVNLNPS